MNTDFIFLYQFINFVPLTIKLFATRTRYKSYILHVADVNVPLLSKPCVISCPSTTPKVPY